MDLRWSGCAWDVATQAGKAAAEGRKKRRRWIGQSEWERKNMRTISTRLRLSDAVVLDRYCREAHVTKYELLQFMVRAWMAAWAAYS